MQETEHCYNKLTAPSI